MKDLMAIFRAETGENLTNPDNGLVGLEDQVRDIASQHPDGIKASLKDCATT